MPKYLPERCQPHSIQRFEWAARVRFEDGIELQQRGRRTAAIYLWGYSAEMQMKAAFFRILGFGPTRQIRVKPELLDAIRLGETQYAVNWGSERAHNVAGWLELLVRHGLAIGQPYDTGFETALRNRITTVRRYCRVELRYHPNLAYSREVMQTKSAVGWILHESANV